MSNKKKNRFSYVPLLIVTLVSLILTPVFIVLFFRFESEPPTFHITPTLETIGADTNLSITVKDQKSGIKRVWVAILKDQEETILFDETLSKTFFFKGSEVHKKEILLTIRPHELGLTDGIANLRIAVWDCAVKGFFQGNHTYTEQKIKIDTRAPSIEVLSRSHNMHRGGSGLVIYRVSEPVFESGVWIGNRFFPGYPGYFNDKCIYMAFLGIPHDHGGTKPFLTAVDFGKNRSRAEFYCYINKKKFKSDTIRLSDNFLKWKMPEFETAGIKEDASLKEKFLYVNRTLRRKSFNTLVKACATTTPKILWKGRFLRLPHSAQKAGFADLRAYIYKNKLIDRQTHLGIDLASTAYSPVPAFNHGKIAYVDEIGIYGKTVIIDHGFGLFSTYSHLSRSTVAPVQEVKKGEIIGYTGTTGLAGGDHLHFGIIINNTFVNPLEWWDATWIKNNITDKISMVNERLGSVR